MFRCISCVVGLTIVICLGAPTWAAIAFEGFEYNASNPTWDGGSGWADGSSWQFNTGGNRLQFSLGDTLTFANSYLGIASVGTGRALKITALQDLHASYYLTNPYYRFLENYQPLSESTLYFSLLVQWANTEGDAEFSATLINDQDANEADSLAFGITERKLKIQDDTVVIEKTGVFFFARIGAYGVEMLEGYYDASLCDFDKPVLLIGGVRLADGVLSFDVWAITPTSQSLSPLISISKSTGTWPDIKIWGSKIARMESGDVFYLDEFVVTRSWAEASHTPEPASWVVMGSLILSGGFVTWRKRKQK